MKNFPKCSACNDGENLAQGWKCDVCGQEGKNYPPTPGPWHTEVHQKQLANAPESTFPVVLVVAEEDNDPKLRTPIAEVPCGLKSDAQLIAAAPDLIQSCVDLLAILENKVESWGNSVIKKEVIATAKKAVAKAKGVK